MKKLFLFPLFIGCFILAIPALWVLPSKTPNPAPPRSKTPDFAPPDTCTGISCNRFCVSSDGTEFCRQLPTKVDNLPGLGYATILNDKIQPPFDIFSWQTFIGINWPADTSMSFEGNDHLPRVWEKYIDADVLMNGNTNIQSNIGKNDDDEIKTLYFSSKIPHDLQLNHALMADGRPLIDRNLNFVTYEKKVNPVEAEFIKKHKLNTKEGIFKLSKQIPNSSSREIELPPLGESTHYNNSMEIKASWRIVSKTLYNDDISRYYTRKAKIYVPAENSITNEAFEIDCIVGLVGMHIVVKTGQFSRKIWATFEHVDNVPDNLQQAQSLDDTTNYSFYNPECLNCLVNSHPIPKPQDTTSTGRHIYKWSKIAPHAEQYAVYSPVPITSLKRSARTKFGTQVVRHYPIFHSTEELNKIWQSKLSEKGSVFANYKLVGSQWSKDDEGGITPTESPFYLSNTTLETYMQIKGSCMSCHDFAEIEYQINEPLNIEIPIKIKTDMSFILAGAK